MSILWSLRKHIDAIVQREEEAAHERDRRLSRRQALGEGDDDQEAGSPETEGDRFQCRVCGHTSSEPAYCPECLADTMVRLKDSTNGEKGD